MVLMVEVMVVLVEVVMVVVDGGQAGGKLVSEMC